MPTTSKLRWLISIPFLFLTLIQATILLIQAIRFDKCRENRSTSGDSGNKSGWLQWTFFKENQKVNETDSIHTIAIHSLQYPYQSILYR
jgi:hypothetical protein